jgi:hypothetical protein
MTRFGLYHKERWHEACLRCDQRVVTIYRRPGLHSLSYDLALLHISLLSRQYKLDRRQTGDREREISCLREREKRGLGRSQIMRRRESLVLYIRYSSGCDLYSTEKRQKMAGSHSRDAMHVLDVTAMEKNKIAKNTYQTKLVVYCTCTLYIACNSSS